MTPPAASIYDSGASSFERHRRLPAHAVEAIRSTIWSVAHLPDEARVLDIGAGTGRIGRAFLPMGDLYAGVDASFAMLLEFSKKPEVQQSTACVLAQADGTKLPFPNAAFDVVLLMQVLSGAGNWREMLEESRRVLRTGGSIVVGHIATPESGIDAQLKRRLRAILEEMQIAWPQPREARRQAFAWLDSAAVTHWHGEAASWNVTSSVEKFLLRHRTGARFAALPGPVQEEAMGRLNAWAQRQPALAGNKFEERHSFELDIFTF